jgi:hypothetical protein
MNDLEKWEDSNPSLILLLEKGMYFSVKSIQTPNPLPHVKNLVENIEFFSIRFSKTSASGTYTIKNPAFKENDFHCEEEEFLEIKVTEPPNKSNKFKKMSSDCLLFRLMTFVKNKNYQFEDLIYATRAFEGKGYEITLDNFMKIALIIQRTRLRLPVICMGETGCGKTYMIKFISKVLLDTYRFVHITLHAGYTETQLQVFLMGICLLFF